MAELLLDQEDGALASRLLIQAVTEVSAELELPEDHKADLMQRCDDILASISGSTATGTDGSLPTPSQQQDAPGCSELDMDVAQLHKQVQQAAERVAALRASAPEVVLKAALQQLTAQRPNTTALQQAAAGQSAGQPTTEVPVQDVAQVSALRARLSAVLDQLPGLRFQLEQAVARLDSNIKTLESEQTRPSPRTVERVLMDRGNTLQPGVPAYGNSTTPKKLALNHVL